MINELLETCEMAKLAQTSRNQSYNTTRRPSRRSPSVVAVVICTLFIFAVNIAVISASSEAGPQKSAEVTTTADAAAPVVQPAPKELDTKPKSAAQLQVDSSQSTKLNADEKATGERKARADTDTASKANDSAELKPTTATESATKPTESNATSSAKPSSKPGKQQTLSGKSSGPSGKSKLPANLGTVTSTGSGGPTHYLSKHDAYSAIAEKHGSLAQVTSAHKKSDSKRASSSIQRFGGIQKASGFGDMLSPFKGVTDSGLARSKYTNDLGESSL